MSKPKIEYRCNLCEHCEGMTPDKAEKHLIEVHHIAWPVPVKKQMTLHGDAARFYFSSYHITGEGVDLTQRVTCRRSKTDPMYH